MFLNKVLASPTVKEGEILTLLLLSQSIRENCSDQVREIIQKICPMINSDRISHQKRLYLLYLSGMMYILIFS